MVDIKYANAYAEVLHYLKGISQEDLDKIPKKLMKFLKENANPEYNCDFDYNKPLKELNLLEESKGTIGMICLNYWCENQEQKDELLNKFKENERKREEAIREKYNPDNIFKNREENQDIEEKNNLPIEKKKEGFIQKIIGFFKRIFRK